MSLWPVAGIQGAGPSWDTGLLTRRAGGGIHTPRCKAVGSPTGRPQNNKIYHFSISPSDFHQMFLFSLILLHQFVASIISYPFSVLSPSLLPFSSLLLLVIPFNVSGYTSLQLSSPRTPEPALQSTSIPSEATGMQPVALEAHSDIKPGWNC